MIKTKKDKRFGGYAHESFILDIFDKSDLSAFLFNLDKKEIYEAKGEKTTIWKHKGFTDSMNFGTGTDLRIFHNFLSQKCYTSPTTDYEYKKENYALNGEREFNVSVLELYQCIFN